MEWTGLLNMFPENIRNVLDERKNDVREIRIRAGNPTELIFSDSRMIFGDTIDVRRLRNMTLAMMDYSYYTRERELAQGFFTMKNGYRVGVCGTFVRDESDRLKLQSIGSVCIRIAREFPGCASVLLEETMKSGYPSNTLIISKPGLGKTTILRDMARQLSVQGYSVAIADERHEIAACRDGIPTLNVGDRTDVADGCDKHTAMEMLVRTMSPQVLISDEIGNQKDAYAIMDACSRGVSVITTAHADGMDDLRNGTLSDLIMERTFEIIALLDGTPGNISRIWRL